MWIFLCAAASAASIDPNLSSLGWGARGGAAQWSRFSPGVNLVIALRLARRRRLMRAGSADGARGELGSII